jgi:4-hydroxybenzoate polyprenyltransferase
MIPHWIKQALEVLFIILLIAGIGSLLSFTNEGLIISGVSTIIAIFYMSYKGTK